MSPSILPFKRNGKVDRDGGPGVGGVWVSYKKGGEN